MRSVTTLAAAEQPWFPPLEGRLTDEAELSPAGVLGPAAHAIVEGVLSRAMSPLSTA
jgi:hypothetical protein